MLFWKCFFFLLLNYNKVKTVLTEHVKLDKVARQFLQWVLGERLELAADRHTHTHTLVAARPSNRNNNMKCRTFLSSAQLRFIDKLKVAASRSCWLSERAESFSKSWTEVSITPPLRLTERNTGCSCSEDRKMTWNRLNSDPKVISQIFYCLTQIKFSVYEQKRSKTHDQQ